MDDRLRVRDAYARYAASGRKQRDWSASNAGNIAIRAELVRAVFELAGPVLAGAREILDVGCGTGWWLEALAGRPGIHARLHGMELLAERAAAARARVPAAEVVVGDARAVEYEDGRFDVVTLFTVLSSLPDRAGILAALREARRVLAPGGAVIVWEPRLPNPLNPRTTVVTTSALRAGLRGLDLQVRTTTLLPPLARRLGSRTERLYPRLARIGLLRTHRLVCAGGT